MSTQEKLDRAIALLKAVFESECDMCADEGLPWIPGDKENEYWHGSGEEIGECESNTLHSAYKMDLIELEKYPQCTKGHQWYGEGCEECQVEESE